MVDLFYSLQKSLHYYNLEANTLTMVTIIILHYH